MHKIIRFSVIALLPLLLLTACLNASEPAQHGVVGELTELMAFIYDNAEVETVPMAFLVTGEEMEQMENVQYYIGSADVPYIEILASEGMMNHSVVLLRIPDDADAETVKAKITETVDPWKWICAGVDQQNVLVDHIGNLVFLVMDDEAPLYLDAFRKLKTV
jgi:hypothetical protein